MRIQLYKVITKVKLDGRPVEGCLLPGTHTHAQTDGQPETYCLWRHVHPMYRIAEDTATWTVAQ